MAIYLKLPAAMGDVEGQVTEENHIGWIEITSFGGGSSRNVESRIGAGQSRTISDPISGQSGFRIHTDCLTGIQYLSRDGSLIPRLDGQGGHVVSLEGCP